MTQLVHTYRSYSDEMLLLRLVCGTVGAISCSVCMYFMSLSLIRLMIALQAKVVVSSVSTIDINDAHFWKANYSVLNSEKSAWRATRPGVYCGLQQTSGRLQFGYATGIIWHDFKNFRHKTSQDLDHFEWIYNNGINYAAGIFNDSKVAVNISTEQVVECNSWFQAFHVVSSQHKENGLIFYFGSICPDGGDFLCDFEKFSSLRVHEPRVNLHVFSGFSDAIGWFVLSIDVELNEERRGGEDENVSGSWLQTSYIGLSKTGVVTGSERIIDDGSSRLADANRHFRAGTKNRQSVFDSFGDLTGVVEDSADFIAIQARFSGGSVRCQVSFEENVSVNSADEMEEYVRGWVQSAEYGGEVAVAADGGASAEPVPLTQRVSELSKQHRATIDERMGAIFQSSKTQDELTVGKAALTNLLGGLGFFRGVPRIGHALDMDSEEGKGTLSADAKIQHMDSRVSLLSGTPSRTVFPRGFLWDEGFHQLAMSLWDIAISKEVITSWLDLLHFPSPCCGMDSAVTDPQCIGGWIPREVILGEEARQLVSDEFVTQRVNIANPPTLLLAIATIVSRLRNDLAVCDRDLCDAKSKIAAEWLSLVDWIRSVYPRLHEWVRWFLNSQQGDQTSFPGSFRWRGRSLTDRKVLPNTLASGLDDYPRSYLPTPQEHHVDLHAWMVKACQIMAALNDTLVEHGYQVELRHAINYRDRGQYLLERLEDLHWSEAYGGYYDVGLHSENFSFVTEIFFRCASTERPNDFRDVAASVQVINSGASFCPPTHPKPLYPLGDGQGGYLQREKILMPNETKLEHIPRVGYISIFPFLLQLMSATERLDRLNSVLTMMEHPKLLFTDYGLRSIAAMDRFYQRRNSPGDAPYWRGPIWININYLALSALHRYGQIDGPYQARIQELYTRLRNNVKGNIVKEYMRTGYFWEHYDDSTGAGTRGHPFTGWTALVANIIAEKY